MSKHYELQPHHKGKISFGETCTSTINVELHDLLVIIFHHTQSKKLNQLSLVHELFEVGKMIEVCLVELLKLLHDKLYLDCLNSIIWVHVLWNFGLHHLISMNSHFCSWEVYCDIRNGLVTIWMTNKRPKHLASKSSSPHFGKQIAFDIGVCYTIGRVKKDRASGIHFIFPFREIHHPNKGRYVHLMVVKRQTG